MIRLVIPHIIFWIKKTIENISYTFLNALIWQIVFKQAETSWYLKSDSRLPKKNYFIYFNENSLKLMKNAFHFILKALFVIKIIKFCLDFWSRRENGLIRKIRLISKFMTFNRVNKQLQYIYCTIPHEVKATRKLNLVN